HHTQIHHYAFISLTFSYIPLLPPLFLFSFTHPSTTEISTLSLHDALPISNIAVWNPTVFRRIPPAQKISLIPVVTEWIKENARIGGVILNDGKWFNVGSVRQYLDLHRTLAAEKWKPHYLRTPEWPLAMARNARVHPTAQVLGCSVVGENAIVATGAILRDTIVWPGAQIASRSELQDCIVRTRQKAEGILQNAII